MLSQGIEMDCESQSRLLQSFRGGCIFVLVIGLLVSLAGPAAAQDASAGSPEPDAQSPDQSVTTGDQSESGSSPSTPVEYCREYIAAFARSSARKMYRALSGQGFDLKPIDLGETVTLDATTSDGSRTPVTFDVLTENDGLVAGIVDTQRSYRRILIAAHTTQGPVVASQLWPDPGNVPSTNACQAIDSQIAVPPLTLGDIDVEPFKFWGLRIVWRLPKGYQVSPEETASLEEALTDALKQSINSN
jgi:hypothetical protein